MAHALSIVHALSNTMSALGQGFKLATARGACRQLVGALCQCLMLLEGGHFSSSFTLKSTQNIKLTWAERRRKKERIMPLIVATYVCHAACLQRRTGSARTSLGPI
jgi:hypothetical protein